MKDGRPIGRTPSTLSLRRSSRPSAAPAVLSQLAGRTKYHFIHVHVIGLVDGKSQNAGEGVGTNGRRLIETLHPLRHIGFGNAARQLAVHGTWRHRSEERRVGKEC